MPKQDGCRCNPGEIRDVIEPSRGRTIPLDPLFYRLDERRHGLSTADVVRIVAGDLSAMRDVLRAGKTRDPDRVSSEEDKECADG